jgi:RNA polymerase sigma-70 factor (ECF subfamily)
VASVDLDRALVRRLLAAEERAFDEFFAAHFPGLFRFALVRMGDDGDAAEEVVQATLCAAVRRLDTYRGEASLFTWLCTFCRHEISGYYRRSRRAQPALRLPEDLADVQAALESLAAVEGGPEESLRRKELMRLVRVALDHLPPHYGDALEWKYIDGLSVAEIGARLEVGTKAAESLLTRARNAFRDAFAALCGGRSAAEAEAIGE